MREIVYEILPPVGSITIKEKGNLLTLLRQIPYIFEAYRIIPPLKVINVVLSKGIDDAGMSGGIVWTPFKIEENEYKELTQELIGIGWTKQTIPDWIETEDDWLAWTTEQKLGIPSAEFKELWTDIKFKENEDGDEPTLEHIEAATKLFMRINQQLNQEDNKTVGDNS
jgi:hypothetical protein